ncbi:dihydrodipicolinate synthase family protein [bacterium]|jgi:dihydrodipicolinate synthase/N-acetylneuraminate lyase|nr:dihydrodipicolinate synthase family protein [bacterium]MDB4810178.1 dihydrodipicolinate synthase family protein [bacterium]
MLESPFSAAQLRESVIAVPPLARDSSGQVCEHENGNIIRFLEAGDVRSLLYGGNAVFYHIRMSEYANTLSILARTAGDETVVIPSIGPTHGFAMDQIDVLNDFSFPTVMILPSRDVVDQQGIARSARILAERLGAPIVLYIKFDRWIDPGLVESLERDGVISWIKYAVVRDNPSQDDYLREILDAFPAQRVVSGIGEQPAIIHLRDFGVTGFTSGCVCVAPDISMQMMRAIHSGQYDRAELIRSWFSPLEDLRNDINPIRVLHHAVEQANIAKTGSISPMLSDLDAETIQTIRDAVQGMLRLKP